MTEPAKCRRNATPCGWWIPKEGCADPACPLSPEYGATFHVEHKPEPEPPSALDQRQNVMQGAGVFGWPTAQDAVHPPHTADLQALVQRLATALHLLREAVHYASLRPGPQVEQRLMRLDVLVEDIEQGTDRAVRADRADRADLGADLTEARALVRDLAAALDEMDNAEIVCPSPRKLGGLLGRARHFLEESDRG